MENFLNKTKLMKRFVKKYEYKEPMTFEEYEAISLKFHCPIRYTRISDVCTGMDIPKNNITVMRSDIGERLKDFSIEKSEAQIIRQSMVNINASIFPSTN